MKIKFDEKTHTYLIDDKPSMGVTSAISMFPKDWIAPWACKVMAEAIIKGLKEYKEYDDSIIDLVTKCKSAWRSTRDSAGDIGKDVHSQIEGFIDSWILKKDVDVPKNEYVKKCYMQFLAFQEKYKPNWIASEQIVGNILKDNDGDLTYCGTFDALAEIDGKIHIIDFKTSSSIKDTFSVQLSAYYSAYMAMGKTPKIDKRSILWIPKEGNKYEFKTYETDVKLDMSLFWSALQFAKYHNIWKEANKK